MTPLETQNLRCIVIRHPVKVDSILTKASRLDMASRGDDPVKYSTPLTIPSPSGHPAIPASALFPTQKALKGFSWTMSEAGMITSPMAGCKTSPNVWKACHSLKVGSGRAEAAPELVKQIPRDGVDTEKTRIVDHQRCGID